MISHALLAFSVPLQLFRDEIMAIDQTWQPHFNTRQYEGDWSVVSLRSPAGNPDGIIPDLRAGEAFEDTSLFHQCPTIQNWIQDFRCPVMAIRLLKLNAGASIKEHRDHELSFEQGEARLHIPVFTNEGVWFHINDVPLQMHPGECWYMNANLPHRVINYGKSDRIHLVIDCQVNDWLDEQFRAAQKFYATDAGFVKQQQKIIAELRLQQSPAATALADDMERKLQNTSTGQ